MFGSEYGWSLSDMDELTTLESNYLLIKIKQRREKQRG